MIAQYASATNNDLGRELRVLECTKTIQDGSHPDEAIEMGKSRVLCQAASFRVVQWVGLEVRQLFVNPLYQKPEGGSKLLFAHSQVT